MKKLPTTFVLWKRARTPGSKWVKVMATCSYIEAATAVNFSTAAWLVLPLVDARLVGSLPGKALA